MATTPSTREFETTDEDGVRHWFRYLDGAPLNDAHFELEVKFLEYWERRPGGQERHFAWVTDLPINALNALALMRARWRIEDETFNTLKNQGYCFEHNFGHGGPRPVFLGEAAGLVPALRSAGLGDLVPGARLRAPGAGSDTP